MDPEHIVQPDDPREHVLTGTGCWCNPIIEFVGRVTSDAAGDISATPLKVARIIHAGPEGRAPLAATFKYDILTC